MGRKRVVYYVDEKSRSPVLEDIRALALKEQEKIFAYISLLEEKGMAKGRSV